jgi:hypothetical protein
MAFLLGQLVFQIAAVSGAHVASAPSHLQPLGVENFMAIPMRLYRHDCWKKVPAASASLAQVPGAGMEPGAIEPFSQVLKDGYYEVACVKDYMHEHGDKFGDGKFAYELGDVSNVSIVNYDAHVPSEDREPMTQDVCFKFCRTVPNMGFFGLIHGRDCYCTPYYTQVASDSSSCDAVCEGDNTMMCGGMAKSSIFQMHQCGDTASDIKDATTKMVAVKSDLGKVSTEAMAVGTDMQTIADTLQPAFGKVGDSAATGLLQGAKVTAGKLIAASKAGSELETSMNELESSAASADASGFEGVTAAETLIEQMSTTTISGEAAAEEMAESLALAKLSAANGSASSLYYPVMYFIDKKFVDVPTTCGGAPVQDASVGDFEGCAAACSASIGPPSCVGFSFLSDAKLGGLCFLFETLTSATYYTGCSAASSSFLQQHSNKDAAGTKCMAKLQDFEGTSIAPDPSGKCEKCLKTATKADRCFE